MHAIVNVTVMKIICYSDREEERRHLNGRALKGVKGL